MRAKWRKELDWQCKHSREVMSDMKHTDSDTVIITMWCPDCFTHRTDEVVGSLARAQADGVREA